MNETVGLAGVWARCAGAVQREGRSHSASFCVERQYRALNAQEA